MAVLMGWGIILYYRANGCLSQRSCFVGCVYAFISLESPALESKRKEGIPVVVGGVFALSKREYRTFTEEVSSSIDYQFNYNVHPCK